MTRKVGSPTRTWVVRLTITSFSVAALMGVAALVTGDEFGDTENRILLTTLLVGVASVLVLCCLSTSGTPAQVVGVAGGYAAVVTAGVALYVVWASFDTEPQPWVGKVIGVGSILSGTLAQSSLLLTIGPHRTRLVLRLLTGTLALAAVLAGLTSALVLGFEPQGSGYARLVGVVAILDVLGTVVVAALAKFGGRTDRSGAGLRVPDDLAARVVAEAEATGRPPEEVLRDLLEGALGTVTRSR